MRTTTATVDPGHRSRVGDRRLRARRVAADVVAERGEARRGTSDAGAVVADGATRLARPRGRGARAVIVGVVGAIFLGGLSS